MSRPEAGTAPRDDTRVRLPRERHSELSTLARRLGLALALMALVAAVAWLGRDGYNDANGGPVGLLDAVYYATVSITTTGYGDVVPASDGARLVTILVVTPARILFLILLVGTTVELLAERTRYLIRIRKWRLTLNDHVIVCGYGTKGRTAIDALIAKGTSRESVVVIDERQEALAAAESAGLAAVMGSGSDSEVLEQAGIKSARAVVVAPDRDDTAILMTLTARELNPDVTLVAAAREAQNVHLLQQSGADSVITSSSAAGRLMGLATSAPRLVEVLEDLLSVGEGLDLVEREVDSGGEPDSGDLMLAVVRGDELLRFDDPRIRERQPGDRLLCVRSLRD